MTRPTDSGTVQSAAWIGVKPCPICRNRVEHSSVPPMPAKKSIANTSPAE